MNLCASSTIHLMGLSARPLSFAFERAHSTMPREASRWQTSPPPSAAAMVEPPEYAKRFSTDGALPLFSAASEIAERIHFHCARCSGKMPRCPKSVPPSRNFTPAVDISHSLGRADLPCQRLPSSRSNEASARRQKSGESDGLHIACEQGLARM